MADLLLEHSRVNGKASLRMSKIFKATKLERKKRKPKKVRKWPVNLKDYLAANPHIVDPSAPKGDVSMGNDKRAQTPNIIGNKHEMQEENKETSMQAHARLISKTDEE